MVMVSYAMIKSLEKCEHSLQDTHKNIALSQNWTQSDFTMKGRKTVLTVLHQKQRMCKA